jgi:hypothetical protein
MYTWVQESDVKRAKLTPYSTLIMSYGNDRYGGGDDSNYSGRNEGNYGGRNEYDDNNNNNGGGYGGGRRQGNNQGEFGDQGYGGQGNSGYGGQNRRDDDSGYDQRRDELRNHGQSGYGFVPSASSSDGLTADGII